MSRKTSLNGRLETKNTPELEAQELAKTGGEKVPPLLNSFSTISLDLSTPRGRNESDFLPADADQNNIARTQSEGASGEVGGEAIKDSNATIAQFEVPPNNPGSCCLASCQLLSAGVKRFAKDMLLGTLSASAGFGVKALVEAAATAACEAMGAPPTVTTAATVVCGGLYIGGCHVAATSLMRAFLNGQLQLPAYRPPADATEAHRQFVELVTTTIPVFMGFCATYAARGAILEAPPTEGVGIAMLAASKFLATATGGAVQAPLTDLVNVLLACGGVVEEHAPKPDQSLTDRIRDAMKPLRGNGSARNVGNLIAGRLVGGLLGNVFALGVNPTEFGPINYTNGAKEGAAAMAAFLTGWFGGMHLGGLVGRGVDACTDPAPAAPVGPGNGQPAPGPDSGSDDNIEGRRPTSSNDVVITMPGSDLMPDSGGQPSSSSSRGGSESSTSSSTISS